MLKICIFIIVLLLIFSVLTEEVLRTYGITFPDDLRQELDSHVDLSLTDEEQKRIFCLQRTISMEDVGPGTILLSMSVNLKLLKNIVSSLKNFLIPVWKNKKIWMSLYKNEFFRLYFDLTFKQHCCKDTEKGIMVDFEAAIEKTKLVLENILKKENATYLDVTLNKKIHIETLGRIGQDDIEEVVVCMFNLDLGENCDGYKGLTSFVRLFSISKFVDNICDVCHALNLSGCVNDPQFKRIEEIQKELNVVEELTLNKAALHVMEIEKTLMLPDTEHCVELFYEICRTTEFYNFACERYYNCLVAENPAEQRQKAMVSFRQTIEVVQHQLANEDYEEQVLQKVLPAFTYIMPFMDKEQDLTTLLTQIKDFPRRSTFEELKVVRDNFNDIEKWLRHVSQLNTGQIVDR